MNWRDTTSYSQGDKDRMPKTWTTNIGSLRITVTCGHLYYPGQWVMHCFDVSLDTVPLKSETVEEAKSEAVELVRKRVAGWMDSLNDFVEIEKIR